MAPQCHSCADLEVRNLSIAYLEENAAWDPENINPISIESYLNIFGQIDPERMSAHRKTKRELFHSASTSSRLQDAGDNPEGSTPSSTDALCACCRHLNLRNLCTQVHNCIMEINLGRIGQLSARSSYCVLCSLLLESLAVTFSGPDLHHSAWSSRTVYLRFVSEQSQVEDNQGTKIYLCTSDGGFTTVLLRVYCDKYLDQLASSPQIAQSVTIPRLVPPLIGWRYLTDLTRDCWREHPECHLNGNHTFPLGFRLIDVKRRNVERVPTTEVPSYAALSYVWGKDANNRYLANKKTIQGFEVEGSLLDLPQTIEDGLEACRQLSIQYLWVDRLCIVQDDDIHKMHQINAMATTYRGAEIVIIAGSASGLEDGIVGISKERQRQPRLYLQASNLQIFASLPSFADTMQHTTWQSRGWTYQEAVLGKRKLYLTSTQAFFDCGEGRLVVSEDQFAEGSGYGLALGHDGSNTLRQYYHHIRQYSRRSLKYQSDVYKAIQGVLQMLYPDQPLHCGLPACDFDQALLWCGPSQHRTASNEIVPPWSWASSDAAVKQWPYHFLGTLVSWSICKINSSGELDLVPAIAKSSPQTWLEWKPDFTCQTFCPQLAMTIAWLKGCIETQPPFSSLEDNYYTIEGLQTALCALWPTYEHFWDAAIAQAAITLASFDKSPYSAILEGTLVGRVRLNRFSVRRHNNCQQNTSRTCDHDGRLQIDSVSGTEPAGMLERPHPDLEWLHQRLRSLHFAAISISELQEDGHCFDWVPRDPNLCHFSMRSGERLVPPKTLWDARVQLHHAKGLQTTVHDEERIWSLDTNIPSGRPLLLVNVILLDVTGQMARHVCKGWMFLSVFGEQQGEFKTVAVSPQLLDDA